MPKYRVSQVASLGALAVALALVGVLGTQNRSLERRYAALVEQARLPYPGLTVPPFDAATLAGDSVRIGESREGSAQILFFFTTTCPYCTATLPAWNRIASEAGRQGGVAIYGIQLDSAQSGLEYAQAHGLGFPLVRLPDPRIRQLLRPVVLRHEHARERARHLPLVLERVVGTLA
ncbi:MAG: peroxiredoxin family protein [Gemmatimonadales bacterium]